MYDLLILVPALPLAGFLILALWRGLPHKAAAAVGVGSVGLSMVIALAVSVTFMTSPPPGHAYLKVIYQWIPLGGISGSIGLYLDGLSVVMIAVMTLVAFLIHLYSARLMRGDEGYGRFFAYMNLFVASMLVLVLASDLLLLYLGWEGVGLCSYLLIGFWYKEPANCRAAMKAFIVTRIGDAALMVALFVIFINAGTLDIQNAAQAAASYWPVGGAVAVAAAALLLAGAVGKSAQLPLQTWLPDAMAGPTPVSALIHAATMVTAGVYLIARMNAVFALAPQVQLIVAIIGAATLVLGGVSAAAQHDLKRALAYSTISQIGYMFLALGVGAWSAAIFHFMTHAFFKSLLFLGAGVVILALRQEHDMFRMGGLRRAMPLTFWTFLVASASMAAIPPGVAGFFSKEQILESVWTAPNGGVVLWTVAVFGVFLTSLYTFRIVFLVFFGRMKEKPSFDAGFVMGVPLAVLAVMAAFAGWLETPRIFAGVQAFPHLVAGALPALHYNREVSTTVEGALFAISQAMSIAGLAAAYLLARSHWRAGEVARAGIANLLKRFWLAGWGLDWLYERAIVRPFVRPARANARDFVDYVYKAIAYVNVTLHLVLVDTQNGRVRWYAAVMVVGAIIILAIAVLS